jgi:hypothetical protein
MLKNKFLRKVLIIAISLAGVAAFASCSKDDDKNDNPKQETHSTYADVWDHLTPAQKQAEKESAYASYDEDPESFEQGITMMYAMMEKTPPADLNPHNWSDNDWRNMVIVGEEFAKKMGQQMPME